MPHSHSGNVLSALTEDTSSTSTSPSSSSSSSTSSASTWPSASKQQAKKRFRGVSSDKLVADDEAERKTQKIGSEVIVMVEDYFEQKRQQQQQQQDGICTAGSDGMDPSPTSTLEVPKDSTLRNDGLLRDTAKLTIKDPSQDTSGRSSSSSTSSSTGRPKKGSFLGRLTSRVRTTTSASAEVSNKAGQSSSASGSDLQAPQMAV